MSGSSLRQSQAALRQQMAAVWSGLAERERRLVAIGAGLLAFALAWWLLIAPALHTLRQAPVEHRLLDGQTQTMLSLAAQARAMQALPRAQSDDSLRALQAASKEVLGSSAQVTSMGNRVTVRIQGVSATLLAQWLAQCRSNARALPSEAHLSVNAAHSGWDGSIVFNLAYTP